MNAQNEDEHIVFHLLLPFRSYKWYLHVSQKTKVKFTLIFKFKSLYDPSYFGKIINIL